MEGAGVVSKLHSQTTGESALPFCQEEQFRCSWVADARGLSKCRGVLEAWTASKYPCPDIGCRIVIGADEMPSLQD